MGNKAGYRALGGTQEQVDSLELVCGATLSPGPTCTQIGTCSIPTILCLEHVAPEGREYYQCELQLGFKSTAEENGCTLRHRR